jgi:hypothetical protein
MCSPVLLVTNLNYVRFRKIHVILSGTLEWLISEHVLDVLT